MLAMGVVSLLLFLLLTLPFSIHAEDLGELSANPFSPDSTSNPFGAGSPFKLDGLNNPFSPYVKKIKGSGVFILALVTTAIC
jgi:hypothetical protein